MAYVENRDLPREIVRFRASPHWSIFLKSACLFALAALLRITWRYTPADAEIRVALAGAALAALVIGLCALLQAAHQRLSNELIVTDCRAIRRYGLLARRSIETSLRRIETVEIRQGFAGRLFGYGSAIAHGAGFELPLLSKVGRVAALRSSLMAGTSQNPQPIQHAEPISQPVRTIHPARRELRVAPISVRVE